MARDFEIRPLLYLLLLCLEVLFKAHVLDAIAFLADQMMVMFQRRQLVPAVAILKLNSLNDSLLFEEIKLSVNGHPVTFQPALEQRLMHFRRAKGLASRGKYFEYGFSGGGDSKTSRTQFLGLFQAWHARTLMQYCCIVKSHSLDITDQTFPKVAQKKENVAWLREDFRGRGSWRTLELRLDC